MKVRCKIDVSPEEYFNFIVDNVRQEVLKYAHKNNEDFKVEKGFSYVKSLKLKDKKYQTKVIIDECEYPSHYKSTTIVENGKTYSIEYLINNNEVYYIENVINEGGEISNSIPEITFGFLKKLAVKKRLKRICEIIKYRKNNLS